ncbi:MAG: hypothetical protein KDG51_05390, partial [Calditrichaeota bacterium]|nr:hypothetical protein [Calditrichota bacterium]
MTDLPCSGYDPGRIRKNWLNLGSFQNEVLIFDGKRSLGNIIMGGMGCWMLDAGCWMLPESFR